MQGGDCNGGGEMGYMSGVDPCEGGLYDLQLGQPTKGWGGGGLLTTVSRKYEKPAGVWTTCGKAKDKECCLLRAFQWTSGGNDERNFVGSLYAGLARLHPEGQSRAACQGQFQRSDSTHKFAMEPKTPLEAPDPIHFSAAKEYEDKTEEYTYSKEHSLDYQCKNHAIVTTPLSASGVAASTSKCDTACVQKAKESGYPNEPWVPRTVEGDAMNGDPCSAGEGTSCIYTDQACDGFLHRKCPKGGRRKWCVSYHDAKYGGYPKLCNKKKPDPIQPGFVKPRLTLGKIFCNDPNPKDKAKFYDEARDTFTALGAYYFPPSIKVEKQRNGNGVAIKIWCGGGREEDKKKLDLVSTYRQNLGYSTARSFVEYSGKSNTCCPPSDVLKIPESVIDNRVIRTFHNKNYQHATRGNDVKLKRDQRTMDLLKSSLTAGKDAKMCYRGLYGETKSCSSTFAVQILVCKGCHCSPYDCQTIDGVKVCSHKLVEVKTSHQLDFTKGTKWGITPGCAPWFTLVDAAMRTLIGSRRQKANAEKIEKCRSKIERL